MDKFNKGGFIRCDFKLFVQIHGAVSGMNVNAIR